MKKIKIPGDGPIQIYPASGKFMSIPGDGGVSVFKPSGPSYLLRDGFTTTLNAAAIPGSLAEPGPGVRAVVITSMATGFYTDSGELNLPVRNANPDTGAGSNFYYSSPLIVRGAGILIKGKFQISGGDLGFTSPLFGLYTTTPISTANVEIAVGIYNLKLLVFKSITKSTHSDIVLTANTYIEFCIVLRNIGAHVFILQDSIWKLIMISSIGNSTNLTLGSTIRSLTRTGKIDTVSVVNSSWLPTPIMSDGFGGTWPTTDGRGHLEETGLGSGGSGLSWVDSVGTWGITSSAAKSSALGVLNGNNVAIATIQTNKADTYSKVAVTRSGNNIGIVFRYSNSTNFYYTYHDGTNVLFFRVSSGSQYPGTQLGTAIAAYAAGAKLEVVVFGTTVRIYYNDGFILSYTTLADTTSTIIGLITTNTENTFDDVVCYPIGSANEYSILSTY